MENVLHTRQKKLKATNQLELHCIQIYIALYIQY